MPSIAMASAGEAVRMLPPMPTVHNAWSDPVSPRGSVASSRDAQNGQTANLHVGNNLYPGAYGYVPTRPASGHLRPGQGGYGDRRGHRRYFYNNFPYPVYYPSLYGDYGVGYDEPVGGYAGLTSDYNVADLGAPDFSITPNNYYSYVAPAQSTGPSAAPDAARPDEPAAGPESPSTVAKSSGDTQRGPDSLVEAVQDELSKRGYFAGKPDALYGPATKEAIRRFQVDQGLPATGRINEATLHALRLD